MLKAMLLLVKRSEQFLLKEDGCACDLVKLMQITDFSHVCPKTNCTPYSGYPGHASLKHGLSRGVLDPILKSKPMFSLSYKIHSHEPGRALPLLSPGTSQVLCLALFTCD